jgi:hypothetical protein
VRRRVRRRRRPPWVRRHWLGDVHRVRQV